MALHPVIAEVVAGIPPTPEDGTATVDPQQWRADEESRVPPLADRLPVTRVEDTSIDTSAGELALRIYRQHPGELTGVVLYFHGGAFFSGSLETHDYVARSLAVETGFTVVAVGYRRAPEAAFPAGLEDCFAALKWAIGHGADLDWDSHRLAVAGDSSGGTFATVVAARALDEGIDAITHQVLLYPSVDLDFDLDRYPSLRENARGFGLETAGLKPHNSFYLESGADPVDPRVSPIKREKLAGLPKTLIITAQFDPLRDEGERYGQRLQQARVDVTVHRYETANHGFLANFGQLPEFYPAFAEIGEFVRG
ncbi:alpha/beta hydrolase [Brevibacterium limosum]|uniref:alpha/beta hydrolase n=1 Tax=Brevibacterium limosum TaxID=2697565 RepID=UPI001420FE44|nr:alpha/beta hydrolase [Brevibacterium limosum]